MNTNEQLARIIELLEDIRGQGNPLARMSIEDEINAVRLQGRDVYEHFKAKERNMPRRPRTGRKGT